VAERKILQVGYGSKAAVGRSVDRTPETGIANCIRKTDYHRAVAVAVVLIVNLNLRSKDIEGNRFPCPLLTRGSTEDFGLSFRSKNSQLVWHF